MPFRARYAIARPPWCGSDRARLLTERDYGRARFCPAPRNCGAFRRRQRPGLLDAGLQIELLHEHDWLPWKLFPMMVRADEGHYRLPDGIPSLPLALSLKARKPVPPLR